MNDILDEALPLASRIALGYCAPAHRAMLCAALALDHRLSQVVARSTEMMLGQMRLAWWRETLDRAPQDRPRGDRVLDAISDHWRADSSALIALVDGWEYLLGPEPLDETAAHQFAHGRMLALLAACGFAALADQPAAAAVRVWALADLASKISDPAERAMLVALGCSAAGQRRRLSSQGRALAVLGALGARGLARGGRPLMEGRSAALVAAKAAILLR